MITRTVFLFVCWVMNWLVRNFYLPKYYQHKIEKFLEIRNILVYHQDKLAWSIGPGCKYLRLCLKYPEAFVEVMLESKEFTNIE